MSIIQGYRGICTLGASVIPVLPGSSVAMPKNYNLPPTIGGLNSFQIMAVEGLQFPVFNFVLLPTADWFTTETLTAWVLREATPGVGYDDVAAVGATSLFDGYSGIAAAAAKHASFNLSVSQGEILRTSAQFWGSGAITSGTSVHGTSTTFYANTPATWAQTGYDTTGIISWDLSWSNNLMPNPALPVLATESLAINVAPSEHNAGMFTARLRVVMQANTARPADATPITLSVAPPNGDPVVFYLPNPLCVDLESRSIQLPRSLREYNYILRGDYGSSPAGAPVQF